MKKLFAIIIFTTAILGSSLLVWSVFQNRAQSKKASQVTLSVNTFPKGLVVKIDGVELGVTPFFRQNLKTGEHLLEVGDFEQKIKLTANTKTTLNLKIATSGREPQGAPVNSADTKGLVWGYLVGYQKLPFLGRKNNLVVQVNEPGAKIIVSNKNKDQRQYQGSIFGQFETGNYQVEVTKKGFLKQNLTIETLPNYLTEVNVMLAMDLFSGWSKTKQVQKVGTGEDPLKDREILPSFTWRKKPLSFENGRVSPFGWQRITTSKLPYRADQWNFSNENQSKKFLSLLEFQIRSEKGYLGLPFCYLIGPDGQVFEGLGVYGFDFSGLDGMNFGSNECPVAFLVAGNNPKLSQKAVETVGKLASFLAERPPLKAKLLSKLNRIILAPGEKRKVFLEFINASPVVWNKGKGAKVILATQKTGETPLIYDPSWISAWQIALFKGASVKPEQVAAFSFMIQAPFFPGHFQQELFLFDGKENKRVKGSAVLVDFKVEKPGADTIEILKTPTGFLNIHKAASLRADLIGVAYTGEKYLVLESLPGWYKVLLHDGTQGFVSARYVTVIDL